MMNRERILSILRTHREELRNQFGVLEIAVFGSAVRDDMSAASDIDIAVELSREGKTLHNYLELERYLSRILEVPVDLGIKDTLKPEVRKAVESEMIYV